MLNENNSDLLIDFNFYPDCEGGIGMTREEKDKLLILMGKERNSYSEHINKEIERLCGKIEGADFILNRLLDYIHNDSEVEDGNVD